MRFIHWLLAAIVFLFTGPSINEVDAALYSLNQHLNEMDRVFDEAARRPERRLW